MSDVDNKVYIPSPLRLLFPRVEHDSTDSHGLCPFPADGYEVLSAYAAMRASEWWAAGNPLDPIGFTLAVLDKCLELSVDG